MLLNCLRKCRDEEIQEMSKMCNKGRGKSPAAQVTQNHVGTVPGKLQGEGHALVGSSRTLPSSAIGAHF